MDEESWFTAEEALQLGLVDAIYEPLKAAASYHGIEHFNLPERIKNMTQTKEKTKTKISPDVDAKLKELESIKAEQKRQNDIEAKFLPFRRTVSTGMRDVMDKCLKDPSITVNQAVEQLHAQLGIESGGLLVVVLCIVLMRQDD